MLPFLQVVYQEWCHPGPPPPLHPPVVANMVLPFSAAAGPKKPKLNGECRKCKTLYYTTEHTGQKHQKQKELQVLDIFQTGVTSAR